MLIGPFLGHFANVRPERQTSHIIYTAVVAYSGILAIFYLALNPDPRLLPR